MKMQIGLPELKHTLYEVTDRGHVKVIGHAYSISPQGALIQLKLYPFTWPNDWRDRYYEAPEVTFAQAALEVFKFYGLNPLVNAYERGNGEDGITYKIAQHRPDGTIVCWPGKETTNELDGILLR